MDRDDISKLRLQLLANGYQPIPNDLKRCLLVGWADAHYLARENRDKYASDADIVRSWARRFPGWDTTGVRLTGGLGAIDGDLNDDALAQLLWDIIERLAPHIITEAPLRYAKGDCKCAWFIRIEGELFNMLRSRAYARPAELAAWRAARAAAAPGTIVLPPALHRVEIFGGAPTKSGQCSRQFGVYGPHSRNERGEVISHYRWVLPVNDLLTTPLAKLPTGDVELAKEIIRQFDAAMAQDPAWEALTLDDTGGGTDAGEIVYDIDDTTRFDTNHAGRGLSYTELCDAYEVTPAGSLRCSTSFIGGRGGQRDDHGKVAWNDRHDCVGVWVFGDEAWHLPKATAPFDTDDLIEPLKAIAAEAGVEIPVALPNWCERYPNGAPRPSLRNARIAIEAAGLCCAYDTFHGRMYLGRPSGAIAGELFIGEVNDARIGALRVHLAYRYDRDFTEVHIRNAVVTLAEENKFDPVLDMLAEAEANWDGVARLDRMAADYLSCEDTELNAAFVRKVMIAAVARARVPGIKFDTMLVMESPQGFNKSSAWALLAGAENFSDERLLGHNTREVQELLSGVWIHENAELAGMSKADVETVTAFASRAADRARPAYGYFLISQPRRSIEVATTNAPTYLQSQYGNRRFWPVRVTQRIDLDRLRSHRLQLWGEAAHYQSQGESLVLGEQLWATAAIEQEERRVVDPWEAVLSRIQPAPGGLAPGYQLRPQEVSLFIVERDGVNDKVATADLFTHALGIPAGQLHNAHSKRLSQVMCNLGWERCLTRIEGKVVRGYRRATAATRAATPDEGEKP